MGWMTGVQFPAGAILGFFIFATVSRLVLVPTQHPVQWVLRAFPPVVKQLGHEGDHSPPSHAMVKDAWSYTSVPPIRLHGMVLS